MKVLISAALSATKKKSKGLPEPVFAKAKSISPSMEKKLDSMAKKAVKERQRTLNQLEKAVAAFKKRYPALNESEVKVKMRKDVMRNAVHPEYLDAAGALKMPADTTMEEFADDCGLDLPAEFYGDILQEIHDTFRNYF